MINDKLIVDLRHLSASVTTAKLPFGLGDHNSEGQGKWCGEGGGRGGGEGVGKGGLWRPT